LTKLKLLGHWSGTQTTTEVGFKGNATHQFTFDHNEAGSLQV